MTDRLTEIEERVSVASTEPWECVNGIGAWLVQGSSGKREDAEFVASARSDVPWLLARVRDLEAALREARPLPGQECKHENVTRLSPLYVDGRPLYRCDDCNIRLTDEDDEPSYKALAPIKPVSRG